MPGITQSAAHVGPTEHELQVTDEDAGARLDRVISEHVTALSRTRAKALIGAGLVEIDHQIIDQPSHRVKPGQRIRVVVPPAAPAVPGPQSIDLEVVYEDADLVVIDKPAGLVVHPGPGNADGTLVNALIAHCGDSLSGIGGVRRPGIVHRLDKDTSGLMLAAKGDRAHRALAEQFAARTITREYLALVWGRPRPAAGEIVGNIGRDPRRRTRMCVLRTGGKPALTRYRTEAVFRDGLASLLACRLETGRTHQIRVHLAHIGYPLVGDPLYRAGRRAIAAAADDGALATFRRQALHARTLGFRHPTSGQWLEFQSPLPPDLAALVRNLAAPLPI